MLQLTETEYLPALANGYRFRAHPRYDGYSGLALSVFRLPVSSNSTYTRHISLNKEELSNKETLRATLLAQAKEIASMPREWNPEFVSSLREIMAELTPPTDAATDKNDSPLGLSGDYF